MNTARYPDAEPGTQGEPEKLVLPARAVERLLRLGLRTQLGEEWWDGYATAHGMPSWVAQRRFEFRVEDGSVVRLQGNPAQTEEG